ncbi:MAG TPA: DUF6338 family protein [Rudaea sp.]|nr:DUF6338 family protein [Rudaea sp.]
MNFAFPALLVFILVLPGVILRYTFARGGWGWTSPTSLRRISDELAYGVVFSIPLHACALLAVGIIGFHPDLRLLFAFLTGHFGKDDELFEPSVSAIAQHYLAVSAYFLLLYASAALLGYFAHAAVRRSGLDRRTRLFRFDNYWYYMLRGEVAAFREGIFPADSVPDGVYLSTVVTHGSGSYLYRGIVEDFTFDADGALDTIAIVDAHRRALADDRVPSRPVAADGRDERYYDIRGDYLVLRCSEMQTMNLDYFWLQDEDEIATA